MPFLNRATSTPLGRGLWQLEVALVYLGRDDRLVVPPGFLHDYASVPRILWPVVGPVDDHAEAAVLHDYLYAEQPVSRLDADGLFRRCLREAGVGRARRWAMYAAVRSFGWRPWALSRRRIEARKRAARGG